MADLSSILGGMVQGFKDFGTGLVDMFGTGGAAIGDAIASIQSGRATTKNQDDFRKWLYNTDSTKDAAAKGLGTILNGVSTVADVIPGTQAVTANPLFNGIQGAIGGVSDELKMAGENADLGRAAQRAGVGAASGLASAYAGQGLAKTGNKLLSNGLTRGAVSGALGGGIANAGYTGIEGGSVQDMINAGLYGAQTGALVGGTTGLARELIKPTHKMDVALTDEEKAARIANIDDQLGKLDLNTPEGNARYAELTAARENYEPKTYYHGSPELGITEFDINRAGKNTRSGEKAIYFTDTPEAAEEFAYERIPTDSNFIDKAGKRGGVYEANLDMRNTLDLDNLTDAQIRELWNYASPLGQLDGQEAFVQRLTDWRDKYHNPQLTKGYIDLEALRNSPYDSFSATMYPNTDNKAREYAIFDASKAKITKSPKTVADLMNEPKQKTVADLMLSPEQKEFFKDSVIRDENGNLKKMYHGSSDGTFTKFKEGSFFTDDKDYADVYQDEAAGMNYAGKKLINPKTYEVYLDVKKPFSMADPEARRIIENEYVGRDKNYWVTDPSDTTEVDFTEADNLRAWLKKNHPEYDGMYVNEGGGDDPFAEEGWEEWRGNSVVPFNANQIKDINNLKPTADADIMRSVALPGSNKKAKITNGVKRIGSDNVAPVDESTLPKGWKELRDILDEKYVDDITKKFGYENGDFSKITPEQYEKYILDIQTSPGKKKGWQNQFEYKKSYMDADEYKKELKNIAIYEAKRKAINDIQDMDLPQAQKNAIDTAINSMDYYATDDNRRYLSHYMPGGEGKEMFANNAASEADAEFSDRLGIGRSNTIKRNNIWSEDLNASGEYKPDEYALAVDPLLNKENAVSTLAHERLHSFQFEAPQGRYDKRVLDAYNELSKDLKPYIHDQATVDERYGKYYKDNLGGKYWGSNIEQEARMMQQYLDNKGYTNRTVDGPRKNEYGEEINKAFDKFFKKLRTLSKKGVALPAITALLGGGAIMAATQSDDKKKKSEVK